MNVSTLDEYSDLLDEVSAWFKSCVLKYPDHITCTKGCSTCCRGLFDITLLDAALLKKGFGLLQEETRTAIAKKADERVKAVQAIWPEFGYPYTLNRHSDDEIEDLLGSDNETPCLLLDHNGQCLLYAYRPMTCRLHGLPLVDLSGEVMESEWCNLNFSGSDPLQIESLQWKFREIFYLEGVLGRSFIQELPGYDSVELDTFIAAALLIDFPDT